MKMLRSKDLFSVMRTCRTLYRLGIPLLLKDIHYYRTRRSSILYRTLLLEDPTRFSYVRALRCDYMDTFFGCHTTQNLYTDFLRYSRRLYHLDIGFDIAVQIEDSALAPIANLPELRRLHLHSCTRKPLARLLSRLTVPLTELGIYQDNLLAPVQSEALRIDFFALAAPFRGSLTSLAFAAFSEIAIPPLNGAHAVSFPHVYQVEWRAARLPTAPTLAALFPAATHLEVACTVSRRDWSHISAQRRHALDLPQWGAAHVLDCVRGPTADVWGLGLACGARELTLTSPCRTSGHAKPKLTTALLHALRPAILVVAFDAPTMVTEQGALSSFMRDGLYEIRLQISVLDRYLLQTVSDLVSIAPFHLLIAAH